MSGLEVLKVKTLKQIAFLTGCATATNKAALITRIRDHLGEDAPKRPCVVSVDMGIRNLAYCVLGYNQVSLERKGDESLALTVNAWNKLDLVAHLQHQQNSTEPETSLSGLFTPASISKLAHNVTGSLLQYKPDVVLIEQQRFRSGGGAAIQEWTVRVNMLESMLWASLETQRRLRAENEGFPVTQSVSPARVAKFWNAGKTASLTADSSTLTDVNHIGEDDAGSGKAKISKQDRMSILRGWMAGTTDRTIVALDFSAQAQTSADRFNNTKSSRAEGSPKGKLDDLTDCLLQGAAWLKWEDNRRRIMELLKQKQAP